MTSYKTMQNFAAQLERNIASSELCKTKVVVTPSSVKEKGVVIKVSFLKTNPETQYQAKQKTRRVKLRVSVCGTVESQTGLEQAVELIEKLDEYLSSQTLRLEETVEGKNAMQTVSKIPNTRIQQIINQEDSFFSNPDSTEVQDVQDDRTVIITFPEDV